MKVKRIGDRIQATVDPGEILNLNGHNATDPEHSYCYPKISDAIRGGVWRLIVAHALKELDGLSVGWGKVDFVNGNYIVTYGPGNFTPQDVEIP